MKRRSFISTGAASLGALLVGANTAHAETLSQLSLTEGSALLRGTTGDDFSLSVKLRTHNGSKGHINFRGYKVAINNDLSDPVWWRMTGSLMGVRNVVKNFAKDGEWFELKIKVSGAQIEVWVDSVKVVEYIEPEKPFRLPEFSNMLLSNTALNSIHIDSGTKIDMKDFHLEKLENRSDIANQQAMAIDETTDAAIRLHQRDFPVLDYHVHLKGGLTPDWALARSRKLGINYAISPNCGRDFQLNKPKYAEDFLNEARQWPFLIAMQAEGREWHKIFPKEIWDKFDFVFTDAMTFDDANGNRTHVWKNEEVKCAEGEEEAYMDWIADTICSVVKEPSDIYANPLWLPEILAKDYAKYWTRPRKQKVLEAIVSAQKPVEINTAKDVPDMEFIGMLKERGVKFTFGTNNINPEFSPFGVRDINDEYGKFSRILKIVDEFKLTPSDMYKPRRRLL